MTTLHHIFDTAGQAYQQTRVAHWDAIACKRDKWQGLGQWYHNRLTEVYRFHVTPNQKVLELGCGDGRLLAALQPARGVGVSPFSRRVSLPEIRSNPGLRPWGLKATGSP